MLSPAIKENVLNWVSQENNAQMLAHGVSLALLVLLSYSIANIIWMVVPEPTEVAILSSFTANSQSTTQAAPIPKISSFHLFGSAQQVQVPKIVPKAVVKPTALNLTLVGVVYAEKQEDTIAIIADANRQQKHFGVGDKIEQGVEVKEIYREEVILMNRGRLETLRLNKDDISRKGSRGAKTPPKGAPTGLISGAKKIDQRHRKDLSKKLYELRVSMVQDPASLADLVSVSPVNQGGAFKGFKVAPGKDQALLARFGLRNGDIITNVNGILLDNPLKGMEVFSKLSSADALDLTVLRRGQQISYQFGISQ